MINFKNFAVVLAATTSTALAADHFQYTDEQFADIQMLRYKVEGFEHLTLRQKKLVYYLSEAALQGRDILYDQNGRYNLRIRRMLEAVYTGYQGDRTTPQFRALTLYLKRVWFSNGIHHHYGSEKFEPGFTADYLRSVLATLPESSLPLEPGQHLDDFCKEIFPVMYDPTLYAMRVNQRAGDDLVLTSGANYYGPGVTQREAEDFYAARKDLSDPHPVMHGLNSRLVKTDGRLSDRVWKVGGLYGQAIERIVACLQKARPFADTPQQQDVIDKLIEYYRTGDLKLFDAYNILWLQDTTCTVDFTNGFIETYGDPLGMKASWEAIVNFKDINATRRTEKLSANAQWFEDHSPVDPRFKKEKCKGISAKVITAAMLGGDLYPSTAIGINLPNSDWLRREYGSKSVTIGNLTDAYNKAAHGNGFEDEFINDPAVRRLVDTYGDACDELHTDLHECLGHGSGKLLPGTDPDSLKAYGATIEEARADLFGLYYVADDKLVELGLTPNSEAYKSQYYTYMLNGLLTQLVRIKPGATIEEAHMRNRALIAHWCYEQGRAERVMELVKHEGKTYLQINDYARLRQLIGRLLAEVQRIKSEGDFTAARNLVETYGVKVDPELHAEVLERYARLHIAPYKGFINPVFTPEYDDAGEITDIKVGYTEAYDAQMLRYSRQYNTLPNIND